MNAVAGSVGAAAFDERAPRRGLTSVKRPLTRPLLVLTFSTGLVDAVSFLGLGRVFTANMTGNVVLLGFGVAGSRGLPVVAPVISLVAFLAGAGGGGALVRRTDGRTPSLVARALGIEVSLLAVAAILAAAAGIRAGHLSAYMVIAPIAFAMGVRNATVRQIAVPDLTTTVLTGTLTGLAAESRLAGGPGTGSLRRVAAVLAMLAGALSGVLLLKTSLFVPLAMATGLALATWLVMGQSRSAQADNALAA